MPDLTQAWLLSYPRVFAWDGHCISIVWCLIFECVRGEGISMSAFGILKEDEMIILEAGQFRSAAILLDQEKKLVFSSAALL
jgi:hypothetical protein